MDTDAQVALLRDARKELSEARTRVAHLEQVVDGLTGLLRAAGVDVSLRSKGDPLPGMSPAPADATTMRPREAALYVLRHREGLSMTARRVYDHVNMLGLVNPEVKSGISAYDMALRRLADEPGSGVSRDEDTGSYIYRSSDAAPKRQYRTVSGRMLTDDEVAELEARRIGTAARGERFVKERTGKLSTAEGREYEGRTAPRKMTEKERAEFERAHNVETRPSRFSQKPGDSV